MKRIFTLLLSMLLFAAPVMAEALPGAAYDTLSVGATTSLTGSFFTSLWGSNAADVDVRSLLHDDNLVGWDVGNGAFDANPAVVSGTASMIDEAGRVTYILSLYDDLRYSDGTAITASDYAFSMLLTYSPELAALGAQPKYTAIEGADAYSAGDTKTLAGVKVLDPHTLAITMSEAYTSYYFEMALLDFCPYPIAEIAPGCKVESTADGVTIVNSDGTTEPIFTTDLLRRTVMDPDTGYRSHPQVVSGPYVLTAYDAAKGQAEFAVNPYYKGNRNGYQPSIGTLTFRHVANDEIVSLLERGEIDLVNKCAVADVITPGLQLSTDAAIDVSNYPRGGLTFISFCCERPAIADETVRHALAMCLDKAQVTADYVGNYGMTVDGFYGMGQWMYQVINGALGELVPPDENADAATVKQYEEAVAAWQALNLDGLARYDLAPEAAAALLAQDGWTLNQNGEPYDASRDAYRCKLVDGQLIPLDLKLAYPETSAIAGALETCFAQPLAAAGICLTIEPLSYDALLAVYYDSGLRDYDMIYLGTNFDICFDPTQTYAIGDVENHTHIADAQLASLAADIVMTEAGDMLTYCRKWIAFQERWTEVLPAIPVYTNVYFDFYTGTLHNYHINEHITWAEAVVEAYRGDVIQEEESQDLFFDEGDLEFED